MSVVTQRLTVFVTVGMGPWPFDRLVAALAPLCRRHDVFAQTGTSAVTPPCPHQAFIGFDECQRRIAEADVIITHGGNTVRLVQRVGKIPIAVAREAARGEMRNDHQVDYLRAESADGRAVVLSGDLSDLVAAVDRHVAAEEQLVAVAEPLRPVDTHLVRQILDQVADREDAPPHPLTTHPTRRYGWAFDQLRQREGRHLDLGVGDATFLRALHGRTSLQVVGADPHAGYLRDALGQAADLSLVQVSNRLPFGSGSFDSLTMLDVLEHTEDEDVTLAEVHRVLRPGGLLVLTVPARHIFSFLDPDNAKFRFPTLHRLVYTSRFGSSRYAERFADGSDGLRGDMAWSRREHTNYATAALLERLQRHGFVPRERDGANLFWRFLQVPALLAPDRLRHALDVPLRADGTAFHSANLFVTAVRDTS